MRLCNRNATLPHHRRHPMPSWPLPAGRRTITLEAPAAFIRHLDNRADDECCSRSAYFRQLIRRDTKRGGISCAGDVDETSMVSSELYAILLGELRQGLNRSMPIVFVDVPNFLSIAKGEQRRFVTFDVRDEHVDHLDQQAGNLGCSRNAYIRLVILSDMPLSAAVAAQTVKA